MSQNHACYLKWDLKDTVTEEESPFVPKKAALWNFEAKKVRLPSNKITWIFRVVPPTECVHYRLLPTVMASFWLAVWLIGSELKWLNLAAFPDLPNFTGTNPRTKHSDIQTSHFSRAVMLRKKPLLSQCERMEEKFFWAPGASGDIVITRVRLYEGSSYRHGPTTRYTANHGSHS